MSLIRTSPAAFSSQMRKLSDKRDWRWRHAYSLRQQESPDPILQQTKAVASTVANAVAASKAIRPVRTDRARRPRLPVMSPQPSLQGGFIRSDNGTPTPR